MSLQERDKIVNILSFEIQKNGPIPLRCMPDLFPGKNYFVNVGPKKWLENEFPEFFVFGNNGRESVDLANSPLAKFYRMLVNTIPAPAVLQVSEVKKLISTAGLNSAAYDSFQAMQHLLWVYPDYVLSEHVDADPSPSHVQTVSAAELGYIHAVAYMNWKQVYNKIHSFRVNAMVNQNAMRDSIVRKFSRAFLAGDGLLLDAIQDESPCVAVYTGYNTDQDKPIYCILKPNQNEGRKQAWRLAGVVYPDEPDEDGLGVWLFHRFFEQSDISYKTLQTQIDDLVALRTQLLPRVTAFLQSLETCVCPEAIAEDIARYEERWSDLNEGLKQFPTISVDERFRLPELASLLDEKNELLDMVKATISQYDQVYEEMKNRLSSIQGAPPTSDYDLVHQLFTSVEILDDVQRFREILYPYFCIKKVLSTKDRGEVRDEIKIVANHFDLDRLDILDFLLGAYSERYASLELLDEIEGVLARCVRVYSCQEDTTENQLDTDALAKLVLEMTTPAPENWVKLYSSLMPEDKQMRALVLGEEEDSAADTPIILTPSSVASRLLAACGNQDRLAERYLLLGLLTDRKNCVLRLLELYRTSGDHSHFMAVWDSEYRKEEYTENDACYQLAIRCEREDVTWDEIEDFVAEHPSVKKVKEYQDIILTKFSNSGQHSAAYRRWLGMSNQQLNEVEQAVAENDTDALYLLLEDPNHLICLGYDADEIAMLQQTLSDGFVSGTDVVAKAQRLYQVQKNKNNAAECLLWSAPLTPAAQNVLFNLYSESGDHISVCWLTQKFSIPIKTMEMTLRYATALSQTKQYPILSELLMEHPELWHRTELLEGMRGEPWEEILLRENAEPISEITPFAAALIEDRAESMEQMLSDPEIMTAWGYSEEMIASLREKVAAGLAPTGTDRISVVKRFRYYQGNLNRMMESYLYQQCYANLEWAIQQLYALSFADRRYFDAVRYYESNPKLQKSDSSTCIYMWSLLHLGCTRELIDQAMHHPNSLRLDNELTKAILEHARQSDLQEQSDDIQQMITRLPRNAFEEAVMQSKHSEMQKYVSDPDLLTSLGYSAESIKRFKERISKPIPYGNEGYPLGVRMRLFFGNERAIPFLEDAMDDPRAVKLLLDIHFSMQKWDAVCSLYRDHLPDVIWNPTYEQRYIEALSKSKTPENCQACLEYLQNANAEYKATAAYPWNYLRCLIGTLQEAAALEQMDYLLQSEHPFVCGVALDAVELAWDIGSNDLREQAALFAARICLKYMSSLTLDTQKALISLNGKLLLDGDPLGWIKLFKDNDLGLIATLLMCYFNFGIGSDPESICSTADALFALLDNPDEAHERSILTALTKFAMSNGLVDDCTGEKYTILLSHWLESILTRDPDSGLLALEEFSAAEFAEFLNFWNTVELTDTQRAEIYAAIFWDKDVRSEWTPAFFQRIVKLLSKMLKDDAYETPYSDQLMEAFTQWFATIEESDSVSLKIAAAFLRDARFNSEQLNAFLESCKDHIGLYDHLIRDEILARCDNNWPEVLYGYMKNMYFSSNQEEYQKDALNQAQLLLYAEQIEFGTDNQALQFAYSIVCNNPTAHNLQFLYELYSKVGKTEHAEIILNMRHISSDDTDAASVFDWFYKLLEEHSVEWIEYHSKWWSPLVLLQEADNQTKSILSYLTDDDTSMRYIGSVLRLLLSDLSNAAYIGCYLHLDPNMPAAARVKLVYIRALAMPSLCEDAIRECIELKQFEYAVKLLIEHVSAVSSHSVFIGQTLGDIYTPESIHLCPQLTEYIPAVFRHIIKLARMDPKGIWKNIGRAVDIAILAQRESLFLDIFNSEYPNIYILYSNKCAALIASLMLRKEFETAEHYLNEYNKASRNDQYFYMGLISSIIGECLETGTLSIENELLLRSIPSSGNMRSLEQYGELVNHSIKRGCLKNCVRAFYRLRSFTSNDKALLISCINLYHVIADEISVSELYAVANDYLSMVQNNQVIRQSQALAVISACSLDTIGYGQFIRDCQTRFSDNNSDITRKLNILWRKCARFLEDAPSDTERRNFLLRAATGWWSIDRHSIQYFAVYRDLCAELAEIYPSAFISGCITAALRFRQDPSLFNTILTLFDMRNYSWGKEQVAAIANYSDEMCERILPMMDSPVDLPGLYTLYLAQTIEEPDDELFIKQITLLLVIQQNYLTKQYEDNVCSLKDMCEACQNSRRYTISRLILKKTVRISGNIQLPRVHIAVGEYEMAIIAAEKQLENPSLMPFLKSLNSAYLDLGQFMTERSTSRSYGLAKLMNMTTLLCQSDSFADVEKLLTAFSAKWTLCMRAAQEMVQGNPENIRYLLSQPAFQTHEWCYAFVYQLVQGYMTYKPWLENLKKENTKMRRIAEWGHIDLSTVPVPIVRARATLIRSQERNHAQLDSFQEFVDQHILLMSKEDATKKTLTPNAERESGTEEVVVQSNTVSFGSNIWKIPFVAECLELFQADEKPKDDDSTALESEENQSDSKEQKKAALRSALKEPHSDPETIQLCGEMLDLIRQDPITAEVKRYCVTLGLAMYREKCEHRGVAEFATEESRSILYSMAALADTVPDVPGAETAISVYLRQCLESYQNLSQLTSDCAKSELPKLCEIIYQVDKDASIYLKKHVLFAREIGQKMREPMPNAEREKWLHRCIASCRSVENPVEKSAKETLANMLNQEIRSFRNKAQLDLTVYNDQSPVGCGRIFGKVDNIGGEGVTNLVLSLYINDMFSEQYSLPALASMDTVPFALPCGDEDSEKLTYKLTLKYMTQDGTEEWAQLVEGTITFSNMDRNHFKYYDASNPADQDNYIERPSITTTLEANYLVDGGFRRFPNFAIYGMKRSGKSSVLRRMGRLLDEHYADSVCHVIVSCEGVSGDFYERVHSVFVKYVMDELNFKFDMESQDGWQEFCDKWDNPPETITDFRWLDSFFTALCRQWLPDKGLVLMVDEIERLYFEFDEDDGYLTEEDGTLQPSSVAASNAQSMLWDVINKMTQRDGSAVRFVLCGSDFFTSKIIAEGDNLTQFFQKGVKLNVDRMEYGEIKEALQANTSITIHDDAIEYLWNIANGLPWHSKKFCNSVIENQLIRETAGRRITIYPADIQDAIDRILSTTKDVASPANFGLLSLNAQEELLVRVASEALDSRLTKISHEELIDLVCQTDKDDTNSEVYTKALRSLVNERKLLKMDKSRNYQFASELYRMYLRREVPSRFMK